MYPFAYHRPKSLAEASELLAADEDTKLLAGGMSLVPVMRHRLARPAALIDLADIAELAAIGSKDGKLWIGAMATHFAVSRSALVQAQIPALAKLAGGIGDPLVRNRGTIGGSLAHNDPAACYPSAVLGLAATIHTSVRAIPADDFIVDSFETALAPGEIITGVSFPRPEAAAYVKFANLSSRFSIVGVFLARSGGEIRVSITGAGRHAFRASALEAALGANFTPEAARAVTVSATDLLADIHASAEYRAHLIPELTARAVVQCLTPDPA
ncbi:MAG TPA: xanthine dehydrogenase family protein subunit M [Stellaceae bacterium]|nr:xanthine dehydrogenase family protein subunit M [Stellaceae bacterium]